MERSYVPYKDLSVGVPDWAQRSYLSKKIQSAVRIQRAVRRLQLRMAAAFMIQEWWLQSSYEKL